jgi:hypothetical protein
MIKGIFILIGIIVAGVFLGEGEVLGVIASVVICTLVGEGIERLISRTNKNDEKKQKSDVPSTIVSGVVCTLIGEKPGKIVLDAFGEKQGEVKTDSEIVEPEKTVEEAVEWECPNCGQMNSKKFCKECGTEKPVIPVMKDRFCINCGEKLKENQKFCGKCGTKVNNE